MRCLYCNCTESKVIDSRSADDDRTIRRRCNNLTHCLGTHITHCKYPWDIGLGGLVRNDISRIIQIQLVLYQIGGRLSANADKQAITGNLSYFSGLQIFHSNTLNTILPQDFCYGTVPEELHIVRLHQGLMIDFGRPESIPSVDKINFFCHSRQQQRIRCSGIATAHLTLAATAEGLGSCIMGWFDEPRLKRLLDIPRSRRVLLTVALGYSTQELRPKQRHEAEKVTGYNKY